MARPYKVGLGYFPLDTDFFHNPKIKALRREYGAVGVLTYLNILCRAYSEGGYWFKVPSIDYLAHDIAEEISNTHIQRVASCVRETISYLIDQGSLDKGLIERGVGSGIAIQEQYVLSAYKAKRHINLGVYQLVDPLEVIRKNKVISEETQVNSEETPVISEESTQSKEKVKERENTTLSYAHPRGKNQNVYLSDEEYADICAKIPDADAYIDRFSEKLDKRGYTYENHHAAILSWWESDKKKFRQEKPTHKGSFDTEEFFQANLKRGFKQQKEE